MITKSRKNSSTRMTAHDYQHKRFRSTAADDGIGSDVGLKTATTFDQALSVPAVVTPPANPMQSEKSFPIVDNTPVVDNTTGRGGATTPRYIHEPTATHSGGGDSPLCAPPEPIRYSLSSSRESPPDESNRGSSDGSKLKSAHSLAVQATSDRRARGSVLRKSKSRRKHDPNAFKIFLLLLQPESKIFELIQLIYNPNDTAVGDIIKMIPGNATEDALGSQEYIGLCRPKTQEEMLDKELLASEATPGVESARISLGEILVAIPEGYTAKQVASLSKQILSNPKIIKLLKRADPLAPKKRRSSRRHHRKTSTRRTSSKERVHIMEKHDEAEEEYQHSPTNTQEEAKMQQAMKHAAAKAADANAAIPGEPFRLPRSNSITSERSLDLSTQRSLDLSTQESLDSSYSSWSKSFDASFSVQSSVCTTMSRRAIRRRERQTRRTRILKKAAIGAFGVMVALYALDSKKNRVVDARIEQNPIGLLGFFQCLFLFFTLYKVEHWVRMSNSEETYSKDGSFLGSFDAAMKRLKSKYTKKSKKSSTANSHYGEDELSHRLRSFSLKAAAVKDMDDTGSL